MQDNVKVTNVDAHRVEAQALDRSETCIDPSDQVKGSNILTSFANSERRGTFYFNRIANNAKVDDKF